MAPLKKVGVRFEFRGSVELRQSLEHHAKRLYVDMNEIIRQAVVQYLEILDDKERAAIEAREAKKRAGAYVPEVVQHRWGTRPNGLRGNMPKKEKAVSKTADLSDVPVADKLLKSFRRWAEFMESADDKSDAERRASVVMEDIKERASSELEGAACYERFKEFLEERAEAKKKPDVVDIDRLAFVMGDFS